MCDILLVTLLDKTSKTAHFCQDDLLRINLARLIQLYMHYWTFVIMGVTGDLAKRKILPSLARFASNFYNEVQIDLVGVSRSEVSESSIIELLNKHTNSGQHTLRSINLIQADYTDSALLQQLFRLGNDEQKMFVYLALPPQIGISVLGLTQDLFTQSTHLIIEKPFGSDPVQGYHLLEESTKLRYQNTLHFIDHYAFKSALKLTNNDKNNFEELKSKKIKKITITMTEEIGVEGRKGYFVDSGTFKDMFSHFYVALISLFDFLGKDLLCYSLNPLDIKKGQYDTFSFDMGDDYPLIETYFDLDLTLDSASQEKNKTESIEARFVSGKKCSQKLTLMKVEFDDGGVLNWNIAPLGQVEYTFGLEVKQISPSNLSLTDHENMMSDLLKKDYSTFVPTTHIKKSWEFYEKTIQLESFTTPPTIYSDGSL